MLKPSLYNSVLKLDGQHTLIFNSLCEKSIIIKNRLVSSDFIESVAKDSNHSLHNRFKECGVIVDVGLNEINEVRERIKKTDNNSSEFIIHINPTLDCTFRCWYCYETHHKGSRMDAKMVDRVKMLIDRIVSDDKIQNLRLDFFGGEPLMYFDEIAMVLLTYAKNVCDECGKNCILILHPMRHS